MSGKVLPQNNKDRCFMCYPIDLETTKNFTISKQDGGRTEGEVGDAGDESSVASHGFIGFHCAPSFVANAQGEYHADMQCERRIP